MKAMNDIRHSAPPNHANFCAFPTRTHGGLRLLTWLIAGVMASILLVPVVSAVEPRAGATEDTKDDDDFPAGLIEKGLRSDIESSPMNYIAAVVEKTGPPECGTSGHQTLCRTRMRIVEMLAAEPSSRIESVYLASGSDQEGGTDGRSAPSEPRDALGQPDRAHAAERFLVFAIPLIDEPAIYGATFMGPSTHDRTEKFRRMIRKVIDERDHRKAGTDPGERPQPLAPNTPETTP